MEDSLAAVRPIYVPLTRRKEVRNISQLRNSVNLDV